METVSIEEVEKRFNHWRQTRSSRIAAIPSKLWDLALALHPRYKKFHICKRLHLSGSQFKQHLEANSKPHNTDDGFVVATPEAPEISRTLQLTQAPGETTLTLQGKDRTLSVKISVIDLPMVLSYFEVLL